MPGFGPYIRWKDARMKKSPGFTLIELLVVISIIALLLSILMPALSKVKEMGRSVICSSNQKQIVFAAHLWSEDNEDWCVSTFCLQPEYLWDRDGNQSTASNPGTLQPYIADDMYSEKDQKVIKCPSAKAVEPYYHGGPGGYSGVRASYAPNGYMTANSINLDGVARSPGTPPSKAGMNWSYDGTEDLSTWPYNGGGTYAVLHGVTKLAKVRKPADTLYFIDCDAPVANRSSINPFVKRADLGLATQNPVNNLGPASRWHSKKKSEDYGYGNIGWVDGHATREPKDFAEGIESDQRCWYYMYDH